ncbi:hypothetical protein Lal_00028198 [Lupinus albus]|nr:hypothetical protein Lal_00028198 [Lupinus albus]
MSVYRRLFLVKENFDPTEVYKSFLRGPHLYIQGQLTKAGSLSYRGTQISTAYCDDLLYLYLSRSCFPKYLHTHASLTICALTFPILSLLNIRQGSSGW